MEQIKNMVRTLMAQRQMLQEERFYVDLLVEEVVGDIKIVKKREWMGIIQADIANTLLLPPVFDHITILSNSNNIYALLCIDEYWGIYNINNGQWRVLPICNLLLVNEDYNTIELVTSNGHGLYDIQEDRVVINPIFDDVTCYSSGDYLWVRLGKWYHFVGKEKGALITIEAKKAYDTPHGIFALGKDDKVFCANEEGLDDAIQLRDFVIKSHGRGRLYNYKLHNMDIIDIYGFVLNES